MTPQDGLAVVLVMLAGIGLFVLSFGLGWGIAFVLHWISEQF